MDSLARQVARAPRVHQARVVLLDRRDLLDPTVWMAGMEIQERLERMDPRCVCIRS